MNKGTKRASLRGALVLLSCTILSACGGLEEGDWAIGSILPPPPPEAEILGAGPAGVGSNDDRVLWSQALEDEDVTGELTFRLVQAARNIKVTQPASITDASQVTSGGATLTINVPEDPEAEDSFAFSFKDSKLGVQNVALTPDENAPILKATLPDGRSFQILLDNVDRSTAGLGEELDSTVYGTWNIASAGSGTKVTSYYTAGVETPDANLPTTGTATFDGFVQGSVYKADGTDLKLAALQGDATITADFGAGTIVGEAPDIKAIPLGVQQVGAPPSPGPAQSWNGLSFEGTFTSGINGFSGDTTVSGEPKTEYSLASVAEGSFAGLFNGPTANEVGAVWNITDSATTASGVLVGKR